MNKTKICSKRKTLVLVDDQSDPVSWTISSLRWGLADEPADWPSCSWGGEECLACEVAVSHHWPGPPGPPGTSPRRPPAPPRCRPAPPRSPRWRSRCRRCRPGRGRWGGCSASWPGRRAAGGQPGCPVCPALPCGGQLTYLEHYQSGEVSIRDGNLPSMSVWGTASLSSLDVLRSSSGLIPLLRAFRNRSGNISIKYYCCIIQQLNLKLFCFRSWQSWQNIQRLPLEFLDCTMHCNS